MKRVRVLGSLLLGVLMLYALVNYVPQAEPYLNNWTVCLIFLFSALLFLFFSTRHKPLRAFRKSAPKRREYIVSGNGELTREEFFLDKHPGFFLADGGVNEAIYCNDTGVLICTRFIEAPREFLANPVLLLGECLAVAIGGLLCCRLYALFFWMRLPPWVLLRRVLQNVEQVYYMLPRVFGQLRVVLMLLKRIIEGLMAANLPMGFQRIRSNLDLSGAWTVVSDNFAAGYQWIRGLIGNV